LTFSPLSKYRDWVEAGCVTPDCSLPPPLFSGAIFFLLPFYTPPQLPDACFLHDAREVTTSFPAAPALRFWTLPSFAFLYWGFFCPRAPNCFFLVPLRHLFFSIDFAPKAHLTEPLPLDFCPYMCILFFVHPIPLYPPHAAEDSAGFWFGSICFNFSPYRTRLWESPKTLSKEIPDARDVPGVWPAGDHLCSFLPPKGGS